MAFKLLFLSDDVCSFFKNKPKEKKCLKKTISDYCVLLNTCQQEPSKIPGLEKGWQRGGHRLLEDQQARVSGSIGSGGSGGQG